jgi:hypothetical protein
VRKPGFKTCFAFHKWVNVCRYAAETLKVWWDYEQINEDTLVQTEVGRCKLNSVDP